LTIRPILRKDTNIEKSLDSKRLGLGLGLGLRTTHKNGHLMGGGGKAVVYLTVIIIILTSISGN
jgi:hypothetical protein